VARIYIYGRESVEIDSDKFKLKHLTLFIKMYTNYLMDEFYID